VKTKIYSVEANLKDRDTYRAESSPVSNLGRMGFRENPFAEGDDAGI
jgi:hypothetical protein